MVEAPSANTLPAGDEPPILPVILHKRPKRKRATARIRGAAIEVTLPKHWPKASQTDAVHQLARRLQREFNRDYQLLQESLDERLSFTDKTEFEAWVRHLNQQTLDVPLHRVRIGQAKYTHMAQMNIKTNTMTVSRYCLTDVPRSALTYLVIHELAHLKVANHSAAFWAEVKRFIPDVRHQRRLIAAVHRVRLYEAELQALNQLQVALPETPKSFFQQLLFKLSSNGAS